MARPAVLVARAELLDGLRNRRQLVVRAVTPLILLGALAILAVAVGDREARATERYRVAVAGPVAEAEPALAAVRAFDGERLVLVPVDDVVRALEVGLDAGLEVHVTGDGPAQVRLLSDATSNRSRAAAALVRAALYEDAPFEDGMLRVAIRDSGAERAGDALADRDDRRALGRAVAGLLLIQASVLVGMAATRTFGRRTTGTFVPQLLLPIDRRSLVGGHVAAETALGVLAGLPLLGLVAAGLGAGLALAGEPATAVAAAAVVVPAAVAVAVPLVAAGTAVGLWARSPQQVAALTAGSFVAVAVLARPLALAGGDPSPLLAVAPLVGPALVVRQAVEGSLDLLAVLLAVLGTGLAALAVLRLAGRFSGREHVALRSS